MATPQEASKESTSVQGLTSKLSSTTCLDMVFIMDATGSMGSYIASAQATISSIVETIVAAEKSDVRFALVSYRDHPPQDSSYVTKDFPFTSSVSTMRKNLDTLSASGGGDGPEAVVDGLHAALKLDYRANATRIAILIADAPPHGLGQSGDGFPQGCPCGLDPLEVARHMAEQSITLYCIGCEPAILSSKEFFVGLAHITGGQYCPLEDSRLLRDVIVGGAREEMALEALVAEVDRMAPKIAMLSEEEQAAQLHSWMQEANVKARQLRVNDAELARPSAQAVTLSKATNLAEVRKTIPQSDISAPAPSRAAYSMAAAPTRYAASFAPAPTSAPMSYAVSEEAVSVAQCSRMIQKSKARNTSAWSSS